MKSLLKYSLLLVIGLYALTGRGQDVSFSQFYANPLYLNPAFAGSVAAPRVALQYRNQWHSFADAYTSYSAAYDMPVKKLQGGLGFYMLNDALANNALNMLQINAIYSTFVRLNETFVMNGAVQVGYNQNSLKTDNLIFADNVDPFYGNHGISEEMQYLNDPGFSFVDFSAGALVYSERYFLGLAAHHLAEPRQSFYEGQENVGKLHRKYSAHFGAKLPVYLYGHQRKKFDISPQVVLQQQGDFNQINYGIFATKLGFTAGMWLRQNIGIQYDALILVVGFLRKNWQIMYSYDMTVSGLAGDPGGTSEISLSFLLKDIGKKQNRPFYNHFEEEFGVQ
ncbi:MAG: PorP/SprF family type IX secretion system membrane protein [Prolixibacteraceae bacterium]